MERNYSAPMAVQIAEEVLGMHRELERLRAEDAELREYREKYIKELNSGIVHSQRIISGIVELAMKPGVMDAIAAANEQTPNN